MIDVSHAEHAVASTTTIPAAVVKSIGPLSRRVIGCSHRINDPGRWASIRAAATVITSGHLLRTPFALMAPNPIRDCLKRRSSGAKND
jgi:hypothetical protein